jgi:hypothetical protein
MPRIGLFLILSLFAGVSFATEYRTNVSGGWWSTLTGAGDATMQFVMNTNAPYGYTNFSWHNNNPAYIRVLQDNPDGVQEGASYQLYTRSDSCPAGEEYDNATASCQPSNPTCPEAGTSASITFSMAGESNPPIGQFAVDGCVAYMSTGMCGFNDSGEYGCTGTVNYSGESATNETNYPSSAPEATEGCIAGTDGTEVCISDNEVNCGTVNGEAFCVSDIPNQNCIYSDNGYKVCTNGTPSNITGTEPPLTEIFDENGSNIADVYENETTVNEGDTTNNYGSNDSVTIPDQEFDTGEAETMEEYETDCDPLTQDCGSFSPPGLGDVPDLGKSTSRMIERIENAAILREIRQITSTIPTGSCSEYTFSLGFTDVSMTEHCTLFDQIRGPLSIILTGIWGFAAVRLFLMA